MVLVVEAVVGCELETVVVDVLGIVVDVLDTGLIGSVVIMVLVV